MVEQLENERDERNYQVSEINDEVKSEVKDEIEAENDDKVRVADVEVKRETDAVSYVAVEDVKQMHNALVMVDEPMLELVEEV